MHPIPTNTLPEALRLQLPPTPLLVPIPIPPAVQGLVQSITADGLNAGTGLTQYSLQLEVHGERLVVQSPHPFPQGTQLLLRAISTDRVRVEQVISEPARQAEQVLLQALREVLPRQAPLARLLPQLLAASNNASLVPVIRLALKELLSAVPGSQSLQSATGLRQAIADSGLFTERRIASLSRNPENAKYQRPAFSGSRTTIQATRSAAASAKAAPNPLVRTLGRLLEALTALRPGGLPTRTGKAGARGNAIVPGNALTSGNAVAPERAVVPERAAIPQPNPGLSQTTTTPRQAPALPTVPAAPTPTATTTATATAMAATAAQTSQHVSPLRQPIDGRTNLDARNLGTAETPSKPGQTTVPDSRAATDTVSSRTKLAPSTEYPAPLPRGTESRQVGSTGPRGGGNELNRQSPSTQQTELRSTPGSTRAATIYAGAQSANSTGSSRQLGDPSNPPSRAAAPVRQSGIQTPGVDRQGDTPGIRTGQRPDKRHLAPGQEVSPRTRTTGISAGKGGPQTPSAPSTRDTSPMPVRPGSLQAANPGPVTTMPRPSASEQLGNTASESSGKPTADTSVRPQNRTGPSPAPAQSAATPGRAQIDESRFQQQAKPAAQQASTLDNSEQAKTGGRHSAAPVLPIAQGSEQPPAGGSLLHADLKMHLSRVLHALGARATTRESSESASTGPRSAAEPKPGTSSQTSNLYTAKGTLGLIPGDIPTPTGSAAASLKSQGGDPGGESQHDAPGTAPDRTDRVCVSAHAAAPVTDPCRTRVDSNRQPVTIADR